MLFTHKLVGVLLSFSGEVAIGEMVAVKALIGSAVGAVENGEGGGAVSVRYALRFGQGLSPR